MNGPINVDDLRNRRIHGFETFKNISRILNEVRVAMGRRMETCILTKECHFQQLFKVMRINLI